jgi:hypothetical protein
MDTLAHGKSVANIWESMNFRTVTGLLTAAEPICVLNDSGREKLERDR